MALTREAADACATAREAATELHRLVPTVHGATALGMREPFAEYGPSPYSVCMSLELDQRHGPTKMEPDVPRRGMRE